MRDKIKLFTLAIALVFSFQTVSVAATSASVKSPEVKVASKKHVYESAKALDIVNNPSKYLNKRVKVVAIFDKFSTLGLDYKPAYRKSDKYISFLIKREDVINNTVPLSEMKIFMTRKMAEKHIDLNSGDIVEFEGLVFSNALSDVWVDVENFKVLQTKEKKDKK